MEVAGTLFVESSPGREREPPSGPRDPPPTELVVGVPRLASGLTAAPPPTPPPPPARDGDDALLRTVLFKALLPPLRPFAGDGARCCPGLFCLTPALAAVGATRDAFEFALLLLPAPTTGTCTGAPACLESFARLVAVVAPATRGAFMAEVEPGLRGVLRKLFPPDGPAATGPGDPALCGPR